MPWLRTDYAEQNRWISNIPRNIWYLRREVQRQAKLLLKPTTSYQFNPNANLWKWLYDFFFQIFLWRVTRNLVTGVPLPNTTSGRVGFYTALHKFIGEKSKKIFGVDLVVTYGSDRIMFKSLMKGCRTATNELVFINEATFEIYKNEGSIQWCPFNKDWYFSSAFINVHSLRGTEIDYITVAAPKIWRCPVCGNLWLDKPEHKFKNKSQKQIVCYACKDYIPSNKPHTIDSVYGDYHTHQRNGWKFFPITLPKDNTVPIGVELEVQFKPSSVVFNPRQEAWDMYTHQLAYNQEWNNFYCERDGSIGDNGLEIITMPMSKTMHEQFWTHMLPKIRERFTGWQTEKKHSGGQYGIHLTFEASTFGTLNIARLAKFLEYKPNQILVQGIAQRGQIYACPSGICATTKKLNAIFEISDKKIQGSKARNQAVNYKSHITPPLVEIRVFNSTLNTRSFYKNLEFLYAFHHWCGESKFSPEGKDFITWLLQHPSYKYKLYPNLFEYLALPNFPVKYPRWETVNPYSRVFKNLVLSYKPGQPSLFEPTAHLQDTTDASSDPNHVLNR